MRKSLFALLSSIMVILFIYFLVSVNAHAQQYATTPTPIKPLERPPEGLPRDEPVVDVFPSLIDQERVRKQTERQLFQQKIQKQRQVFKEKLQLIRNEKKKIVVERIDERISTMNKKHTLRFDEVLGKLEILLGKISDKSRVAKDEGRDVDSVESAIDAARSSIESTKSAVNLQAQKVYVIDISEEALLRAAVGKAISEFRKDLKSVHKQVIDAKKKVQNAERELVILISEPVVDFGPVRDSSGPVERSE